MNLNGFTYFQRGRFSINESEFPNIHVSWKDGFFWYIALSPKLKWWRGKGRSA